jgi:peptide-methionine (S)-S-oxide reductase
MDIGRIAARSGFLIATAGAVALAGAALSGGARAVEGGREIPAPLVDERPEPGMRTAVFAGGCFWGVQAVFQHVDGVANAVSGYAGGEASTARYEQVGTGRTGHAEAVKVTYDPSKVSFGELLRIHMSVAHDPNELDRQGPDTGPQYRSAVFPQDAGQARVAKAYIEQLGAAKPWPDPVVTTVEGGKPFFKAEAHHQDFLARNPDNGYILMHDLPKLGELERLFPERYRETPVLTATAGL